MEDKRTILKEEKTVAFATVYEKCVDKISGKISDMKFEKFLDDNVIVKDYIKIANKRSLIDTFHIVNNGDMDFSDLTFTYEIYSVLHMLFSYTNINITSDEISEQNYDAVMESGLYWYIKSMCEEDYNVLYNMMYNSLSFKNYQIMRMFEENYDVDGVERILNNTTGALREIDEEKLALMKDIMDFNNPALNKIKDMVYDATESAIKDVAKE